jgi:hypothetical protein
MSDSIVPAGSFAALAPSEEGVDLQEIVEINMGPTGVDPSMLDRVKVPSGGSTIWEVPGLGDETEAEKELVGVIVGIQNVRSYFASKYTGGNEPPDCSSSDGINGIPSSDSIEGYGGKCATCPKSQWGSAVDDDGNPTDGQACSQRKLLMLLRPDSMLPLVVNVPPSSLKELDKLLLRLTAKKVPFFGAVVSLKLIKEKSGGGIEYSKISPRSCAGSPRRSSTRPSACSTAAPDLHGSGSGGIRGLLGQQVLTMAGPSGPAFLSPKEHYGIP